MLASLDRSAKFLLLVVLLMVSMGSLNYIPFIKPLGVDLLNIVLYHQCSAGTSPYLVDAVSCGDPLARGMYYPPLLFHSFAWVKGMDHRTVMRVWLPFSVLALAAVFYVWVRFIARERKDPRFFEIPIFCALIAAQFPFGFALERGQTDIVAVVLLSAGCYLYTRRQPLWAGVLFGAATAFKLYPIFACAIVGLGLVLTQLSERDRPGAEWLRFGLGAFAAFVVGNLLFFRDAKLYYTKVLPEVSAIVTPAAKWVHAHSFSSLVGPDYSGFTWSFCAGLVALWGWATSRAILRNDAPIALAGSMAPTTYFAGFTYDYNLITIYPLLLMLFLRARKTDRWALLAFGLFAVMGNRQLFERPEAALFNPTTHIMLQLAFLVAAAIVVAEPAPA